MWVDVVILESRRVLHPPPDPFVFYEVVSAIRLVFLYRKILEMLFKLMKLCETKGSMITDPSTLGVRENIY